MGYEMLWDIAESRLGGTGEWATRGRAFSEVEAIIYEWTYLS